MVQVFSGTGAAIGRSDRMGPIMSCAAGAKGAVWQDGQGLVNCSAARWGHGERGGSGEIMSSAVICCEARGKANGPAMRSTVLLRGKSRLRLRGGGRGGGSVRRGRFSSGGGTPPGAPRCVAKPHLGRKLEPKVRGAPQHGLPLVHPCSRSATI